MPFPAVVQDYLLPTARIYAWPAEISILRSRKCVPASTRTDAVMLHDAIHAG